MELGGAPHIHTQPRAPTDPEGEDTPQWSMGLSSKGIPLCPCPSLPAPGSLLHQGDFYPPSILRNYSNMIKHRLSVHW